MNILYNFASRSRPSKFFATLDNIIGNATHPDYFIVCTLDIDDVSMNTKEVRDKIAEYPKVIPYWGFSTGKIDAINKNVCFAPAWTILVNVSDDFVFLKHGFDTQIIEYMNQFFPDGDGFLHLPDGAVNHRLCTLSILGKPYYDRFGYIYHPDYKSVYCDQEATEVAKILGKHVYVDNQLFVHNHPVWRKAEWDEQYRKTEDPVVYAADAETYQQRKARNFDLKNN